MGPDINDETNFMRSNFKFIHYRPGLSFAAFFTIPKSVPVIFLVFVSFLIGCTVLVFMCEVTTIAPEVISLFVFC